MDVGGLGTQLGWFGLGQTGGGSFAKSKTCHTVTHKHSHESLSTFGSSLGTFGSSLDLPHSHTHQWTSLSMHPGFLSHSGPSQDIWTTCQPVKPVACRNLRAQPRTLLQPCPRLLKLPVP